MVPGRILFIVLALSGTAVFAGGPVIPVKAVQTVSPGERWTKAVEKLAHGKADLKAKGPVHFLSPASVSSSPLPHWTGQFNTRGVNYSFTMVGTDPDGGSATTNVDTAIIPFKLIFPDGTVFDATQDLLDGQTPLQGALQSPVFQNASYTAGTVNLGNTQFADAFQRANFWKDVSMHSPNYHLLLSPRVLPTQVVTVPDGFGITKVDSSTGRKYGLVDILWLDDTLLNTMFDLGVQPSTLAINLFGEIVGVGLNGEGALGYHSAVDFTDNSFLIQGAVTYIFTDWFSSAAFNNKDGIGNTGTLGHEVAEWADDPFIGNLVPYWQDPATPNVCEQDFLEVGDPLEKLNYFTVTVNGFTYTLPDVTFLPWFARETSTSVNGWFSFRNQLPGFSKACPGFVDYNVSSLDYPDAAATVITSIDNHQRMAGYWIDNSSNIHSFILNGNHLTPVNVPGSGFVQANTINDTGVVAGFYLDGSSNQHGFALFNGKVTTVDYPGAVATSLDGLNDGPGTALIAVGTYSDSGGVLHGFEWTGGNHFQTIDSPFGVDTALNGINDIGQMAGSFDDGNPTHVGAFAGTPGHFSQLTFPASTQNLAFSVNQSGQVVGTFNDSHAIHGFLENQGLYGQVDGGLDFDGALVTFVFDNNDIGVLVGYFVDVFGIHGFIATPAN